MAGTFSRIWRWLAQKAPELKHLSPRDAELAYFIARIEREKISRRTVMVPLFSVQLIHDITRPTALEKVAERVQVLTEHKADLLSKREITQEFLGNYLPSLTWIKVIRDGNSHIAFEGNGRLLAFQQVFQPSDNMEIEVELFEFNESQQKAFFARAQEIQGYHFKINL